MSTLEVKVPALGDFEDVPVIEVLVKPGDAVAADDGLLTLESEKATMDVPSPAAGTVKDVRVKVGDRVSEGTVVLLLETAAGAPAAPPSPRPSPPATAGGEGGFDRLGAGATAAPPRQGSPPGTGAAIRRDSPLGTGARPVGVEIFPSPPAGARSRDQAGALSVDEADARSVDEADARSGGEAAARSGGAMISPSPAAGAGGEGRGEGGAVPTARPHASPSVRRLARELGVDLARVTGGGPKGRILRGDVQAFVKQVMSAPAAVSGPGLALPPWPKVDFAKYGPIETRPLSRIQRISGPVLSRNWVTIPHVTQLDEADITDLEAFRKTLAEESAREGVKVTLLAFVVKACVAALRRFPEVNASLEGDHLVLKHYFHIGFAADTPGGLVVPVLRNADQKGILEIAKELAALAARAREGKLSPADISGGTFSISSLGGIGGTAFTPIINAPEVAILGVSRAVTRPVWDGKQFAPRLVLPLSFSYDHRVVDGALAARFTTFLAQVLGDMRRATL